jgi:hypothetical protein
MIAIAREKMVTLRQGARLVPSRTGNSLNITTMHRWVQAGVRGVRLESLLVGGVRMTSVEAIQRFVDRLNAKPGEDPAPTVARDGHERAEAILKSKGFND